MDQTPAFQLLPYVLALARKWRTLLAHGVFICIVAIIYAFFIVKKEYQSSITFLPPPSESSLGSLMGGVSLPSMSSSDVTPAQIGTICESSALKRKVIEKFNLYEHYDLTKNPAKFVNAEKRLNKDLSLISEVEGSIGIVKTTSLSLVGFHTSADTAFFMVNYAFSLIDSTVQTISADRAHKSRVFVETQLKQNKTRLDSLQIVVEQFQRKNKAYNIPEQLKMTTNAYAQLKSTMLANEMRINYLKSDFSVATAEIADLEKQNRLYGQKILQLETRQTPDVVPSFEASTKLMLKLGNLMRDLETQNQVYMLLTKEFEQAKIKEAKYVSSLAVTDPAFIAEYKARPKRVLKVAMVVGIYMSFIMGCYAIATIYSLSIKSNTSYRKIIEAMKRLP